MRKNGFTLIELLAVIVILAIIALIATPIILGIINDAREESEERSVELYASAVRNAVAAYQLTGTSAPTSFSDLTIQYEGEVECDVEELYEDGSFYLEGCKVNNGTKEYSYGTKQESEVSKACTIERQDANKYSVGDVVTCNIGDTPDKFYVIADAELTASTIQMLTEKNIHTTQYRQDNDAGIITFSQNSDSNLYNDENNNVKPIVDEYVSYLNTKLTGVTGRLLTYNEAVDFGCNEELGNCSSNNVAGGPVTNPAPSWLYLTSYWLETVYSSTGEIWYIGSDGFFYYHPAYIDETAHGVRPVITISTSDIQ